MSEAGWLGKILLELLWFCFFFFFKGSNLWCHHSGSNNCMYCPYSGRKIYEVQNRKPALHFALKDYIHTRLCVNRINHSLELLARNSSWFSEHSILQHTIFLRLCASPSPTPQSRLHPCSFSASSVWWLAAICNLTHFISSLFYWQFPPHFSGQVTYLVHGSLIPLLTINCRYIFSCLSLLGNLPLLFPTSISTQLSQELIPSTPIALCVYFYLCTIAL